MPLSHIVMESRRGRVGPLWMDCEYVLRYHFKQRRFIDLHTFYPIVSHDKAVMLYLDCYPKRHDNDAYLFYIFSLKNFINQISIINDYLFQTCFFKRMEI